MALPERLHPFVGQRDENRSFGIDWQLVCASMTGTYWRRPMGKIVGIDLGTTNSVVCVMEGKEVKVIPNKHGSNLTPSVVGFPESGDRLVGQLAKRQAIVNPRNTVYSIKRFMGRRHSEVGQEEKMVPYEVVGGPEDPV